jgi:two-component system response regulator QseB
MRILIVEDDAMLLDGLTVGLGLHGMTPEGVASFEDAAAALATTQFDAIVLDLMLPDGSGLELLSQLRRRGDATVVLLLTARDAVADRIAGLDCGADDYLGKPFDLDELAARLRALGRRARGQSTPVLQCQDIAVDPARHMVTLAGRPIATSRREFSILQALMERPGMVQSKHQLEARLYGWQEDVESNTVEVHIHHLRAKIGRDAIETVRGIGYRMRLDGK